MVIKNSERPFIQEESFEAADVENYRADKIQVFNHQVLVMEQLRKVNEAGSHELRPGSTNRKIDNQGNTTIIYIEDTRKKFIECVKSAMSIMACDYDEETEGYINQCLGELKAEKEKLLKSQWQWYQSLPPRPKAELVGDFTEHLFNMHLGWYLKYLEISIECYRAIVSELHHLTKRLDFYQAESLEVN